jgi:hypothetical protein
MKTELVTIISILLEILFGSTIMGTITQCPLAFKYSKKISTRLLKRCNDMFTDEICSIFRAILTTFNFHQMLLWSHALRSSISSTSETIKIRLDTYMNILLLKLKEIALIEFNSNRLEILSDGINLLVDILSKSSNHIQKFMMKINDNEEKLNDEEEHVGKELILYEEKSNSRIDNHNNNKISRIEFNANLNELEQFAPKNMLEYVLKKTTNKNFRKEFENLPMHIVDTIKNTPFGKKLNHQRLDDFAYEVTELNKGLLYSINYELDFNRITNKAAVKGTKYLKYTNMNYTVQIKDYNVQVVSGLSFLMVILFMILIFKDCRKNRN